MEKINLNKLIKEAILKKKGISLSEYENVYDASKYGYYTKQYLLVSKEIS